MKHGRLLVEVEVYLTDPDNPEDGWTVAGDLRTPGSDMNESNYEYEDRVKAKLPKGIGIAEGATFDSEFSCFYAYCSTRPIAEYIAGIAREVAGKVTETTIREGETKFELLLRLADEFDAYQSMDGEAVARGIRWAATELRRQAREYS